MTETKAHIPTPLVLENEHARGVVYADPGAGKTTFALSFPKPLVIDTDAGLVSVALYGREAEMFDPTGYKDLENLYLYVKQNADRYESIIIDSFTELQRLLLDEIVDDGAQRDEAKGKLNSITRFVPEQGEYLANQRQLRRVLDSFRRLNKNVILTAGVRMRGMQRTPDCAPGALSIVSYWSSFIGEIITHAESPDAPLKRYMVFEPTAERMAKTRYAGIGRYIELPPVDPSDPGYTGKSGYDVFMEGVQRSYTNAANANYDVVHVPPTKANLAVVSPEQDGPVPVGEVAQGREAGLAEAQTASPTGESEVKASDNPFVVNEPKKKGVKKA